MYLSQRPTAKALGSLHGLNKPVQSCQSFPFSHIQYIVLEEASENQLYLWPYWMSMHTHWKIKSNNGYRKYSDTQNICCNHPEIWTRWLYHRVMHSKDADRIANSIDPDQTTPLGAVWSGCALFARVCLSENLNHNSMSASHDPAHWYCRYLASGSGDTTVRFWDVNTETPQFTCKGMQNFWAES